MDRRAFLLGAIAAPIAAPVLAQAVGEPVARRLIGLDLASGPDRVGMALGEIQGGVFRIISGPVSYDFQANLMNIEKVTASPPCEFWTGTATVSPEVTPEPEI